MRPILFPSLNQAPSPPPGTFNTQSPIIALVGDPSVSYLVASLKPAENLVDDLPQGDCAGGFSRIQFAMYMPRAYGRSAGRVVTSGFFQPDNCAPSSCSPVSTRHPRLPQKPSTPRARSSPWSATPPSPSC